VEEVHQLHRLAFSKSSVVDAFRLVVQLELDREDLDVFCKRNCSSQSDLNSARKGVKIGLTKVDLLALGSRSWSRRDCSTILEAEESLEEIESVLVDVKTKGKDFGLTGKAREREELASRLKGRIAEKEKRGSTHSQPPLLRLPLSNRSYTLQLDRHHVRIRLPHVPSRIRPHLRQELLPRRRLDVIQDLEILDRDLEFRRQFLSHRMALHLHRNPMEVDLDPRVSRPREFRTTMLRRLAGGRVGRRSITSCSSTFDGLERRGLAGVVSSSEIEKVFVPESGEVSTGVHVCLKLGDSDVDRVEESRSSLFNALVGSLAAREELADLLESTTDGFDFVFDRFSSMMPVEAIVKEEGDVAVGDSDVKKGRGGAERRRGERKMSVSRFSSSCSCPDQTHLLSLSFSCSEIKVDQ